MTVSKKNFRNTPLNLEQLEARMLMTVSTIEQALESLELVSAAPESETLLLQSPDPLRLAEAHG